LDHQIVIYTEKITTRIEYIFDFIFWNYAEIKFAFCTNFNEFQEEKKPKINFSNHFLDNIINYNVDEMFLENDVRPTTNYHSLNPIGKCFYWLSRYEEYIAPPQQFDQHNRFVGSDLDYSQPIVDLICLEIQEEINLKYPEIKFKKRIFSQINTHDVDFSWKYLNKPFYETIGSLTKKILKRNFTEFNSQLKVLNQKEKDPYAQFNYLKTLAEKHKIDTIFFWLLGDKSDYDRNINWQNEAQIKLINSIKSWAKIGIHPSYLSNFNTSSQQKEIKRLEKISNLTIYKSRQHFIKLNFPYTYQQLLINGIKEDYTMGFAHQLGFRAGTSISFRWFDLSTNQPTLLIIHPFVAMDVTLKNYLGLTPEQATKEIRSLKQKIRNVNGNFITIFHQSNLEGEWKEWVKVYESLFDD